MKIDIPYGDRFKEIEVPDQNTDIYIPKKSAGIKNIELRILKLCDSPISQPPLSSFVDKNKKIAIIVDDNTRPTPSHKILKPILKYLDANGAQKENIKIYIALGIHRKMNEKEKRKLLSDQIVDKYQVINHNAADEKNLIMLGKTSFGTPIKINKAVYNADLRILTGLIKPHNQAGFSGGGKSILPGVSGEDTIASNHSYKSISHPASALGIIENNPIRDDIEECFTKISNNFIFNFVMDYQKNIIDIVAGDPIKAHRAGVKILREYMEKEVKKKYDLIICGTPAPISKNFYQMLNSLSAAYKVKSPPVKKNGSIVVFGPAAEGISDGDFYQAMKNNNAEKLWEEIKTKVCPYIDRPALQIFLEGYLKYNIFVITDKNNLNLFNDMNINSQASFVEIKEQLKIENKDILVLPYAPYSIVNYHI